jgi:hypothetical protein
MTSRERHLMGVKCAASARDAFSHRCTCIAKEWFHDTKRHADTRRAGEKKQAPFHYGFFYIPMQRF